MEQPPRDTKDWTWTIQLRCPDCGLEAGVIDVAEIADRIEAGAAEWVQILTQNPAADRRPAPVVWSPLEYGAHVRDALELYDARLVLMLIEDNPAFKNWDQDEAAISGDYVRLDPDQVATELADVAQTFVARIRSLEESQLDRRGTRSDGAEFTVRTFLQYFLHDLVHHLWDVTGQQQSEA
ncbi:DinB family protein [Microlunatus elymi]|uniref:DinB family protein n=1 Tax=Microlunatus elymi TaxID=2596828 RepID=A0A516PXK2_9ACTN|nr:DinB family protein [Microlunatus elymi]QDP95691.1 DinB family protein [Microlunatus elymi]